MIGVLVRLVAMLVAIGIYVGTNDLSDGALGPSETDASRQQWFP